MYIIYVMYYKDRETYINVAVFNYWEGKNHIPKRLSFKNVLCHVKQCPSK